MLLVGGEVFRWKPWIEAHRKEGTVAEGALGNDAMAGRFLNKKGQWEVPEGSWALLELVWPKPGMRSSSARGQNYSNGHELTGAWQIS